jgi:hypothetical protein
MSNVTIVTGIWDIGRESLGEGWSRDYQHYLDNFNKILDIPNNMIIFGDSDLRELVFEKRQESNTQFIERDLNWFKQHFFQEIQKIRTSEVWYNQVGWLSQSTQARLEMYNPLVMSKPFILHDAKIFDKFNSTHLFWLDGGITNTVHPGYFTHDKVLEKLQDIDKFSFIAFPYKTETEIHGFNYKSLCELSDGKKVEKVMRGGFFGGPKEEISTFNSQYYELMKNTLENGWMGTEESLFTILAYKYPEVYQYFEIEGNGLIWKFFEDLKDGTHKAKCETKMSVTNDYKIANTGLYVITFNSPKQFQTLIDSMLIYDKNFIDKPTKFLLDNSSDESTTLIYTEICQKYGFEHIKKDNLGICGGRQFIAEHAEENKFDFYFFFEDDMFFYPKKGEVCKNGFNRYVDNLYLKSLNIVKKNSFDFIKLSFTEFYGDNTTQWAWYNVPQVFREEHWPNKKTLPVHGLDPNPPKTKFNSIQTYQGVPYADGEIYYCNWPQIVTKDGNKKMFLTEKWARPFEQTWMSYMFQETIKGNLKSGLLLITPTEHDRFDHYDGKLRKES